MAEKNFPDLVVEMLKRDMQRPKLDSVNYLKIIGEHINLGQRYIDDESGFLSGEYEELDDYAEQTVSDALDSLKGSSVSEKDVRDKIQKIFYAGFLLGRDIGYELGASKPVEKKKPKR